MSVTLYAVVDNNGVLQRKYKGNPYYVRRADANNRARRLNNSWRGVNGVTFSVKAYRLSEV